MTPADVAAAVLETVGEWMPGYTFPGDGTPQERVDVDDLTYDPPSLVVAYRAARYGPADRAYRVTLTVEEIPV